MFYTQTVNKSHVVHHLLFRLMLILVFCFLFNVLDQCIDIIEHMVDYLEWFKSLTVCVHAL